MAVDGSSRSCNDRPLAKSNLITKRGTFFSLPTSRNLHKTTASRNCYGPSHFLLVPALFAPIAVLDVVHFKIV